MNVYQSVQACGMDNAGASFEREGMVKAYMGNIGVTEHDSEKKAHSKEVLN